MRPAARRGALLLASALLVLFQLSSPSPADSTTTTADDDTTDAGLFLSPFVKNGSLDLARSASSVDLSEFYDGNITSYAGYVTVNETYNSNLWFWFFPAAKAKSDEAPLLIWLQGGPGQSSLLGLFKEIGPFFVDEVTEKLIANPYSWHNDHNLVFVDNPIGSGFSFTDDTKGYARNQKTIGEHLYSFLKQFLQIYTDMQRVPLYVCGESFGAKHALSLVDEILTRNPESDLKMNLQGIAISSGFIDPISMIHYSDLLYHIGLIDENARQDMKTYEEKCERACENEQYYLAREEYFNIAGGILDTGVPDYNNYAADAEFDVSEPFSAFVARARVRRALRVRGEFRAHFVSAATLLDDFMVSARAQLERALDHVVVKEGQNEAEAHDGGGRLKVLLYGGQLDLACAWAMSSRVHRALVWHGSDEYRRAERTRWRHHDGRLAGFAKKADNFLEVLFRNAGHMVAADQPERALWLIKSFINDFHHDVMNNTIPHEIDTKNK